MSAKLKATRKLPGLKGSKFKIAGKRSVPKATAAAVSGKTRSHQINDDKVRQREYTKRTQTREANETARFKEAQKTERARIKKDSKLQQAAGTALKTTSATSGAAQNVAAARGDDNLSDLTSALIKADATPKNEGAIDDDGDQGGGTDDTAKKKKGKKVGQQSPDSDGDITARSTADPRLAGLIF